MSIMQTIKGSIVEMALGKTDERIDGREITSQLKPILDEQFGVKSSSKIRHVRLWNFVRELAEGLFEDNIDGLRLNLMLWAKDLKPKGGMK